jgi:Glycosyltransferase Family 4
VRLLLATRLLDGPGGAESYLLTVAEELRRLGHDVTLTAPELGPDAGGAREAGLTAVVPDAALDRPPDAILVQDRALSLRFAREHPQAPQVFVVHGSDTDFELPQPGIPLVTATVVMNDRHASVARAVDGAAPVVRLRQPIDMKRFRPTAPPRETPRTALVLTNSLAPARLEALRAAWEPSGIEVVTLGRNQALGIHGHTELDPRREIAAADIVVGYGRAMLEAMASGRAAFVFAGPGGDGWVTEESYATLEADGFTGGALPEVHDEQRLRSALSLYDARLGQVGRDLVRFPHDSRTHAVEIARLLTTAAERGSVAADHLAALERAVGLLWAAEVRTGSLRIEAGRLYAARDAQERRIDAIVNSRRYRLAGLLARPLDALRRSIRR